MSSHSKMPEGGGQDPEWLKQFGGLPGDEPPTTSIPSTPTDSGTPHRDDPKDWDDSFSGLPDELEREDMSVDRLHVDPLAKDRNPHLFGDHYVMPGSEPSSEELQRQQRWTRTFGRLVLAVIILVILWQLIF